MLQGLYWETYGRIIDAVNKHDIPKGYDREVSAFLIYITFSIVDEDAAKYIPVHPDEFYHHRLRFYLGLKRSDLLNNWNCPSVAEFDDNPLFISFIAFGDLLINSYARSDYRTAPLQARGFTETMEFSMTMLSQILPCINSYVERLFECRKRGRIGAGKSRKHALSNKSNHSRKKRKKNDSNDIGALKFWVLLVLGLAAIVGLCYFIMQGSDTKTNLPVMRSDVAIVTPTSTPRPTATPRRTATPTPKRTTTTTTDLVRYYQVNFPQTWGYISKNADSPGTYLRTYDRIWGDLQRYRGDGIPFNTLTRYEQSLVHYPAIGNVVYVASSSSSTYHSTRDCYTLLKSSSVSAKPLSYMRQSGPCSKCVGE